MPVTLLAPLRVGPTWLCQAFHAFSHPVEESRQERNRGRGPTRGLRWYFNENGDWLELLKPAESTPDNLLEVEGFTDAPPPNAVVAAHHSAGNADHH